ncbi:hypothetical protein [Sigmofec virus UA08Rod_5550]|uniref:Uncharacterized protein n=1 Tax=Sigmofec virus UA08Rod_5550 TaxID=2929429 RepID=A0A976N131_9VIRU|nr:hypothetical protein [Sigmofec virus UA08Rod_5550]
MSDSKKVILYTYRYMWKEKDKESISFKIITDTLQGHEEFEKAVMQIPNLEHFAYEYLHEYDCSRVSVVGKLFDVNDKKVGD